MNPPVPGLRLAQILGYGALGLPLAFAALPVYVFAPKFYAGLGLSLGTAGTVLLLARMADALIDPWLGVAADRARSRKTFIAAALLPLALGMLAMFHPPSGAGSTILSLWLGACVAVTYFGFSAANIAYQAWGARLGNAGDRTAVAAAREGCGLAGVVLASILPQMLAPTVESGLPAATWIFMLILALCAAITLGTAPGGARAAAVGGSFTRTLVPVLASARFRRLLAVFALNGIASAIPATLFLFFVADILQLADKSGMFLALYFIAAAIALPLWVRVAARWGKRRAWLAAMVLAIAAFMWAYALAAGQALAFGAIAIASGAALGADLALPPAMLADTIETDRTRDAEGAYFGIWNLVTKLNLALAAGLTLPALAAFGYTPGAPGTGAVLPLMYCLLPCVLKLGAIAMLLRTEEK